MMQFCRTTRSAVRLVASRMSYRGLSTLAEKQSGYGGSVTVGVDSDDVAVITMNRGENRMNDEFIDQMNAALDHVLSEPAVKGVITTSDGKFFCNGLDLQWMGAASQEPGDRLPAFLKRWHELHLRMLTFPMPSVAAINGHCYAGGGVLSLCHDYRVMQTDRGWWCLNEAYLGIQFPPWIIALARMKLSAHGARALLDANVFGRRFPAAKAKDAGVINETCPSAELVPTAKSVINTLLSQGTIDRGFVEHTKKQIFHDVIIAAEEGQAYGPTLPDKM